MDGLVFCGLPAYFLVSGAHFVETSQNPPILYFGEGEFDGKNEGYDQGGNARENDSFLHLRTPFWVGKCLDKNNCYWLALFVVELVGVNVPIQR